VQRLNQLTQTQVQDQRRYRGFNLLAEEDASLFRLLLHGEFTISGFTNRPYATGCPGGLRAKSAASSSGCASTS